MLFGFFAGPRIPGHGPCIGGLGFGFGFGIPGLGFSVGRFAAAFFGTGMIVASDGFRFTGIVVASGFFILLC